MKIFRYIKNFFKVRKKFIELKNQVNEFDKWRFYISEKELYNNLYNYTLKLYNLYSDTEDLKIKVDYVANYLESSRDFVLSAKLMISMSVSCCQKLKMISNLWEEENGVKYSLFKGSEIILSGKGEFSDCIKEIEQFLKEKDGEI